METDYGDDSRCSSSRIDACLLWVRRCYVFPIKIYRLCLSPYFGTQCRFYPTCSAYAIEAIMTHGIFKGSALMVWRLLRCNPWSKGGYDPVPKVASGTPAPETTPALHHCGSSTPGDNHY